MKIGGEFDINPEIFNSFDPQETGLFLYSSGSAALLAILQHIAPKKKTQIYVPFYICEAVVNTCINAGFIVKFYELDDNFRFPEIDLNKIHSNTCILLVNYFGFVDNNELIKTIKRERPDLTIIADNVQSYWDFKDNQADFSFTSLRKHFAMPDGALLHSNDAGFVHNTDILENSFHWPKLLGSVMKNAQVCDKVFLYCFEKGEHPLYNVQEVTKASRFGSYLYANLDFELAKNRRKSNTKTVYRIGREYGLQFLFEYDETIIPLCVPILIENRDMVRSTLFRKNIFLPVHWPKSRFTAPSEKTERLIDKELSVVIDQRYSEDEIEYEMINIIKAIENQTG